MSCFIFRLGIDPGMQRYSFVDPIEPGFEGNIIHMSPWYYFLGAKGA